MDAAMWFSKPKQIPPPLNILDEVADAIGQYRTQCSRPGLPINSRLLSQQFQLPITAGIWTEIGRQLQCQLPPLKKRVGEFWTFPKGWSRIDDIVEYVGQNRTGLIRPQYIDDKSWVEAQIYVRVRRCICDCIGAKKEEVFRGATLVGDLGME